jgi:PAS domain S-box-containing protein
MPLGKLKKLVNSLEPRKVDEMQIAELKLLIEGMPEKKYKDTKTTTSDLQFQSENLFSTESYLKAIIDSSFGIFFLLDINKHILLFNKLAEERFFPLFNRKIKIGDDITQYSPQDKLEQFNNYFDRCLSGEIVQVEELLVFPSGQQAWTENILHQVKNQEGKILGIAYRSLDITARKNAEESLRKSGERYRMLFESAPLGILTIDLEGNIIEVNPMLLNILGSPSAEETKKINMLTFEPIRKAGFSKIIEECIKTKNFISSENSYTTIWGKQMQLRINLNPLLNDENEVIGVQAVVENFTEITKARQEISNIQERYREIFENANDLIYTMDFEGNFTSVNPVAEKWLGYKIEEVKSRHICKYLTPESLQISLDNIQKKLSGGAPHTTYEAEAIAKDSRKIILEINSFLRYKNGVPSEIFGIARDIRERKKAEKALRESEEKYRIIIENIDDVIFSAEVDATIIFVSLNCYNLLGYTPEEIIGKNLFDFVYKEDLEFVSQEFQKILLDKITTPIVCRVVTKKGQLIYIEESGKIIFDKQGNIKMFTGIIRDISIQRKAEEQIKSALQEKEVLLREIHHRVKNNLQVIISLINMHMLDFTDREVVNKFRELQERVRTMSLVHEDLYMSENLAQIEFKNYINKLTSNLFSAYGVDKKINCSLNISSVLLDIDTAIPSGLVVNELVSNALKYAFPSEKLLRQKESSNLEIYIEFREENDKCILIVRDNGIGLPKDFSFQTNKTMGLRLVKILVNDQLNGSLKVKNNPGAEFVIEFNKRKKNKFSLFGSKVIYIFSTHQNSSMRWLKQRLLEQDLFRPGP